MPAIDADHPLLQPKQLLLLEADAMMSGRPPAHALVERTHHGLQVWRLMLAEPEGAGLGRQRIYAQRGDGVALLIDKLADSAADAAVDRVIDATLKGFAEQPAEPDAATAFTAAVEAGVAWASDVVDLAVQAHEQPPSHALIRLGESIAGWQTTERRVDGDDEQTPLHGAQLALIRSPGLVGAQQWAASFDGRRLLTRREHAHWRPDRRLRIKRPVVLSREGDRLTLRQNPDDKATPLFNGPCPKPLLPPRLDAVSAPPAGQVVLAWKYLPAAKSGFLLPTPMLVQTVQTAGEPAAIRCRRLMSTDADVAYVDSAGRIDRYRTLAETQRPLGGLPMTIRQVTEADLDAAFPEAKARIDAWRKGLTP